jgi:AraC-like DNA-binding protein
MRRSEAAAQPQVDESVRGVPAPALRPFIAWYSGYRQVGVPPGRHRGLPSPYLTVIFTLDDPLVLAWHPDPRQPPGSYRTLVGGLHTAPALVTHQGRQSGIQVHLSPLGARSLLGMPAGELASLDVDGPAVLGALADQITERLREAPDWPARFAVLDRMLSPRLGASGDGAGGLRGVRAAGGAGGVSAEVGHAWRRLLAADGRCGISALAAETGWSERHLRSRFREETGLTPKAAARVIRFDRARRLLQVQATTGEQPSLARLAADCGYYDQAHLAREFRELAGCPPSAWLAEEFAELAPRRGVEGGSSPLGQAEFRNVQAAPDGAVPGWRA